MSRPTGDQGKAECPRCGEDITVVFWTEWHPYGSTVAGEPMADFLEGCGCDLSDDEQVAVIDAAERDAYGGEESDDKGCSECRDWFDNPLNGGRVTAGNPVCPIRGETCVRFS